MCRQTFASALDVGWTELSEFSCRFGWLFMVPDVTVNASVQIRTMREIEPCSGDKLDNN